MKKLKGTDFLVLNANIIDKTQDPKVAREAVRVLRDLAPELGNPGTYLRDSLDRFFNQSERYKTLEQAFGLERISGPPVKAHSEKDAEVAYKCFERRLKGELAKQLEYKGYSKRKLTQIQSRYLYSSIQRASEKRGEGGFSEVEKSRLANLLSRRKRAIAAVDSELSRWVAKNK